MKARQTPEEEIARLTQLLSDERAAFAAAMQQAREQMEAAILAEREAAVLEERERRAKIVEDMRACINSWNAQFPGEQP